VTGALRRRIVETRGRRVHLWCGGSGPTVVMLHGSPGNACLLKPLAQRLTRNFSVYAVDTPGFGGSDALQGPIDGVAQLADAYRDILDALGLSKILIYGTHSGAAIGLELARRHPSRVCGFVLDGVPAFTAEEMRPLLAPEYHAAFEPELLGGHYARVWTRFHDQFIWFPWYRCDSRHLLEANAGSAADIHLWVDMYFQAAQHDYRPVYRAVIAYGEAAIDAARAVSVPGVYMAERTDMLFSHLDRLPPLHDGQRIERLLEPSRVPERIEAALLSLSPSTRSTPDAALDRGARPAGEYFYDLPGGQMLVRSRGDSGPPLLLLHDAPGAGRQLLDLYHTLSVYGPVLLPDLPGCGDSDPLELRAASGEFCTLADYADAIAGLLASWTNRAVVVHGVGFGAALALELNARHPGLVSALSLTGLLRTSRAARLAMIGRLAPPIALAEDGSHWYRTWLMLRDSLVRWPWYAREPGALRRQTTALDSERLHEWTCDVMRQWHSYHHLIDAVLEWNPEEALARARRKLTVALDARHALHAADAEWAASGVPAVIMPEHAPEQARVLASMGTRSTPVPG
jgi:pimeloyl-ACP methyl ester carboxylesterase